MKRLFRTFAGLVPIVALLAFGTQAPAQSPYNLTPPECAQTQNTIVGGPGNDLRGVRR